MDALIASAPPLKAKQRRAPTSQNTVKRGQNKPAIDPSLHSILPATRTPSSFHDAPFASTSSIKPDASTLKVKDKKLKAKLAREDIARKRAAGERDDVDEYLNTAGHGAIEVDAERGERTWRVKQDDVLKAVGVGARAKKFDLKLENMGEYTLDYTRNGRSLAIASERGHVATFDTTTGNLYSEIQLGPGELARDIKFLHSDEFYAVAQRRYVFVYDKNGVEIHKMKQHIDVTNMEFLPYHYLLATVGNAGHLKYQDTSTGTLVASHPTRLGPPSSMAQNPHNAIVHIGHQSGTVTLWSPNLSTPHVKLQAHLGPVRALAVDPSAESCGRYMATAGLDGKVKIWDARMWGQTVNEWHSRVDVRSLDWSQRGMLAVGGKSNITIYNGLQTSTSHGGSPTPYLSQPFPSLSASHIRFTPYEDQLTIGHAKGISTILVPGAGEAQFDSTEADVYESYSRRRERDVRAVLEKIRPELITLDEDFLGRVRPEQMGITTHAEREARPFRKLGRLERLRVEGKAEGEEDEEGAGLEGSGDEEVVEGGNIKEKHKMRGKGKSMKRFLKKKKKNVIDPALLAVKAKVHAQAQAKELDERVRRGEVIKETGALARFS